MRPVHAAMIAALLLPGAALAQGVCEEGTPIGESLRVCGEATLDAVANLRGGVRSGQAAVARLRLGLDADFVAFGLEGWRAGMVVYGIAGRQPTPTLAGGLAPVSNIEALPTLRLSDLWLERRFDGVAIRFGQLAADTEFATSDVAGHLVNGTFGWPVALAGALPSGGPAYPLAAPGLRVALGDPDEGTGLRLGVFAGDPGGRYGEATDPQRHNRYGTNFSTTGGVFYLAEAVTGAPAREDTPRAWVLKIGGWYHSGGFDSVRRDGAGLSLADPAGDGIPRRFGNNYGGYALAEVTPGEGPLGLFVRAFLQPADRNAVDLQIDAGLAWRGALGVADDTLSLGLSWARIGGMARGFDRDLVAFGTERPVRTHETALEVNYDHAVSEQVSVRPLVQALFHPAAGEPDERRSATRALPDAVLVGLRITARF